MTDRPSTSTGERPACITVDEFLAIPRQEIVPYVGTADGSTTLLARGTTLQLAGPSGVGKSLVGAWDLGGRLAADRPSDWLGMHVCGGLRVALLTLEGSDEDTADRARSLLAADARRRLIVWDRWRGQPPPSTDDAGLERLASELRRVEADIVIVDTASAMFGAAFDIDIAAGEAAHSALERLRLLSGRPLAFVVISHQRKRSRNALASSVDELEEVSGTFARKTDALITLRRFDRASDDDPRRRVRFSKVRQGLQPRAKAATFPTATGEPPRLTVLADAGRAVKQGTEAENLAEWIAAQEAPATVSEICAVFDIGVTALGRDRRPELEELGVRRAKLPGRGNTHAYGTDAQWRRLELGEHA